MRLLLDTHVWLWMLTAPERLGSVRPLLEDVDNELLFSAACSWEITIKYSVGRLPLPEPPSTFVPSRIRTTGVTPIPIDHQHALEVAELPPIHRDPFDRLLIAQARFLDVPLATADGNLKDYEVATLTP